MSCVSSRIWLLLAHFEANHSFLMNYWFVPFLGGHSLFIHSPLLDFGYLHLSTDKEKENL